MGRLYSVDFNAGSLTSIADFANYELVNNPDQGDVVSNSYALAIQGDTALVADAGANDLLSVGLDGSNLTAVTLFPSRPLTNPIFPYTKDQLSSYLLHCSRSLLPQVTSSRNPRPVHA